MERKNVTKMERRWRKGTRRGVSPIIATILLVAITVVLAAVLYILISGLTRGPGNTPLGSAFAFGTPSNNTTGATYSYGLPVASATGMTLNNLKFQILTSSGSIVAPGAYSISLLGTTGATVGVYSFATATWTTGGSTTLSTGQIFWLHAGTTGLLSDSLSAIGQGSFSGNVGSSTFP